MGYLLQYRYQVGDVLRYQQTTTMVLDDPDTGRLSGKSVFEYEQAVTGETDGKLDLEFRQRVISQEGPLAEGMPAELMNRGMQMRMDRNGTLYPVGPGGPPGRMPSFPAEQVEIGDTWTVTDNAPVGGQPPLSVTFTVDKFEMMESGDVMAYLSSEALTKQVDNTGIEVVTTINSSIAFSVGRGCQAGSQTVVKMQWPNRTMQTVVELQLLERRVAEASR